jgi:hypothetical protein
MQGDSPERAKSPPRTFKYPDLWQYKICYRELNFTLQELAEKKYSLYKRPVVIHETDDKVDHFMKEEA